MQPPVVRKQIADIIRRRGEPTKIQDMEGVLKLPYGNIMQACTRAVAAGEFIKTAPGTFGLPGVAYHTKSISASRRASSGSLVIPKRKKAEVRDISSWVSRVTRDSGND